MTVSELITRLHVLPQDADVLVADSLEGPEHWTTDMILCLSDTKRSLTLQHAPDHDRGDEHYCEG